MRRISRRHLALFSAAAAALVLMGGLLLAPSSAQRQVLSMDDAIATGKSQLFQKTVPSILQAYSTFRKAAADPSYASATADQKIKIRAYLAITRMLDTALRTEGEEPDTLTKILSRYGFLRSGVTLETLAFQAPLNNAEKMVLPAGAPSGEAVRAFLAGPFLNAVNASIADLDEAISLCGAGKGTEIIDKNLLSPDHPMNVEVDIGEYRLFRAALKGLKALVLILSAYNIDVNVRELAGLLNSDSLNFKALLDRYPDLFKLLTAGGMPACNGAAKLAEAKAAFIGAIDDYTLASEKIRTDKTVTLGAEKLVGIEDGGLLQEAFYREEMGKLRTALTGNQVYEMVHDKETWDFTETATGEKIQVIWERRKSEGFWRRSTYGASPFVGYPGHLEYTILNGTDVALRLRTNGTYNNMWFGAAEFRGTLSSNGTVLTGSYRTGLQSQSWDQMTQRGVFSAQRIGLDDTEKAHVNPNIILGNGTTAPNLRDLLPEFTAYGWGLPRIGTMGHGLGNDATLNGLLPDMTQKIWGEDSFLMHTGSTSIPVAAIVVDGLINDWTGMNPVFDNSAYVEMYGDPGRNVARVFLAQDGANLYVRMDTAGNRQNENGSYDYGVRFTALPGGGYETAGDKRLYAAYRGYRDTWTFTTTGIPSKQMTIDLWGATEWGQYNDGSGFFTGPAGDTVFPQGASLRGGYLSGSWMYLDFGSFSFSGTLSADRTRIENGSYSVYSPVNSWGNFTGARTGHIPYWQTFLATLSSAGQWISTYLGDNLSMGINGNVEWKVPLSQIGNLAGLFIKPDTRLWAPWQQPGRTYPTGIQIGPTSAAQTISGILDVPGYNGKGIVRVGVYLYGAGGFDTSPENRLSELVLYPGQYIPGMTYTIPGIPTGKMIFLETTWDRDNLGFVGPGVYRNVYAPFITAAGSKTLNISASKGHMGFPTPTFNGVFVQRLYQSNNGQYSYQIVAFVVGPSPEDVTVTATGPGGQTYALKPAKFNRGEPMPPAAKGLSYEYSNGNVPLPQGEYVFEAVDSLGRKVTTARPFVLNSLPALDYTRILPASFPGTSLVSAYTGTTTPTFSWTLPADVPSGCQWMVYVKDYHTGNMIFKSALLPRETASYTMPAGYLQGNTTYTWFVMLWDGAFNNGVYAANFFTTAAYTETPLVSWAYMLTHPPTGGLTSYITFVPFGIGVVPPEISSVRLKNANDTVIAQASFSSSLKQNTRLYGEGYYYFNFASSTPLPAGNYKLEVVLNRGGGTVMSSQPIPYAFTPVQPIDATSLTPAHNDYYDTPTPTFSWAKTGDANAWYHVRIYNPIYDSINPNIEFYRSPWLKDASSWTVPAGVLKPGMTYLWTLYTSSDYDPAGPPATGPWHSAAYANIPGNSTIWIMNRFTINAYLVKGDLNNDGVVNLYDGILALQVGAGTLPSALRSDYGPSGVDVNGDNKVGLAEVLYILQQAAAVR